MQQPWLICFLSLKSPIITHIQDVMDSDKQQSLRLSADMMDHLETITVKAWNIFLSSQQSGPRTSYFPVSRVDLEYLTSQSAGWTWNILLPSQQDGTGTFYFSVDTVDLEHLTIWCTKWTWNILLPSKQGGLEISYFSVDRVDLECLTSQ